MENILNKESVKRVDKDLKTFDLKLKVEVLNSSARTAIDAASSLKCEIGAIVKSLLLKADDGFVLCLVSGDKKCSLNKVKNNHGVLSLETKIEPRTPCSASILQGNCLKDPFITENFSLL